MNKMLAFESGLQQDRENLFNQPPPAGSVLNNNQPLSDAKSKRDLLYEQKRQQRMQQNPPFPSTSQKHVGFSPAIVDPTQLPPPPFKDQNIQQINYGDQSDFAVGRLKPAIKMSQPLVGPGQNENNNSNNNNIAPLFTKFAQNDFENDLKSQVPLEFQHAINLSFQNQPRNQPNFSQDQQFNRRNVPQLAVFDEKSNFNVRKQYRSQPPISQSGASGKIIAEYELFQRAHLVEKRLRDNNIQENYNSRWNPRKLGRWKKSVENCNKIDRKFSKWIGMRRGGLQLDKILELEHLFEIKVVILQHHEQMLYQILTQAHEISIRWAISRLFSHNLISISTTTAILIQKKAEYSLRYRLKQTVEVRVDISRMCLEIYQLQQLLINKLLNVLGIILSTLHRVQTQQQREMTQSSLHSIFTIKNSLLIFLLRMLAFSPIKLR